MLKAAEHRSSVFSEISELIFLRPIRPRAQSEVVRPNKNNLLIPSIVVTKTSRKMSANPLISRSATNLSSPRNHNKDSETSEDESFMSRCMSLETGNVFDRGKHGDTLKRSNSMDDASRSSTLKSNMTIPDDPDLDVSDECHPWSTRFPLDESLSKKELRRQDIIAEFIHTERTYLRNLILLHRAYQEPLLSSDLISTSVSNRIFLNLPALIKLHRKFKEDLMKLQQPPTDMILQIGDCIADFFDQPSFSEEITKYCKNLTDSLIVLKERMRNSDFATFLIECESNRIVRRKHLKELLPNPMQRVTKYPLLIAQIQKFTEQGTTEYDSITYCLEKIKDVCDNVNKEVAKASSDRIEKSARAWMLTKNKSLQLELGECRMNVPVFCDDIKQYVNLVMYDRYIVLFPNARSILYSSSTAAHSSSASGSTSSENQITVRYIELSEGNLVVSNDKQEPRSFYLISVSKPEPIITPIICNTDDECKVIFETLKRASTNTDETIHQPKVELIDLKIAENLMRNRPVLSPSHEGEGQGCEIDERGRYSQLQGYSSPEGSTAAFQDCESTTVTQRISQIDSQILTLLTAKLDIMTEQNRSRKLPARARDITQSVAQLTSDADTLHEVALDLLEGYSGEDRNSKLTRIRGSYQSMLANIGVVCTSYNALVAGSAAGAVPIASSPIVGDLRDDDKSRRHSIVDRIRSAWNKDTAANEGGGVVRRCKNRSRANTTSPALKPSPRSSTESLNKVNTNRLSGCSHYSTDSDTTDCVVEQVQKRPLTSAASSQVTPRSISKAATARREQAKSTAFDNLFRLRGSGHPEPERPVITGPVLQHTTNKRIPASDLPPS